MGLSAHPCGTHRRTGPPRTHSSSVWRAAPTAGSSVAGIGVGRLYPEAMWPHSSRGTRATTSARLPPGRQDAPTEFAAVAPTSVQPGHIMIVRPHGSTHLLVTQPDHAALAGRIMECWVADA